MVSCWRGAQGQFVGREKGDQDLDSENIPGLLSVRRCGFGRVRFFGILASTGEFDG